MLLERIHLFSTGFTGRCVQGHENSPEDEAQGHQAHAHHGGTRRFGQGINVPCLLLHQPGGKHQREGGTQAGDGQLHAHGEGHRPSLEPAGNASRDGRSGNFTAQAKEHDAHVGQGKGGGASAEQGPKHHPCASGHHEHEDGAGDAHSPLVQQEAAYHQTAKYAQDAVAAGIEPVPGRIPAQFCERGILKQVGDAGEHVVEVVRCEHRHYQTGQHYPGGGAVKFLYGGGCHYSSAAATSASMAPSDSTILGCSSP